MDAFILSIGTELTTGQQVDTNAAWLSAELTRMGIRVLGHITTGDDVGHVRAAISQALDGSQVVILTGGLGPTPDDLTRYALAEAVGQPLVESAETLERIRALFGRLQRPMPEANKVQAMIPRGCDVIPNDHGTAPGIWYHGEDADLFALPGVPAEMKAMFLAGVAPVLEAGAGAVCGHEVRVLCFGISEAKTGELLGDLMRRDRNPLIGTTASRGMISVRIAAHGKEESDAKRLAAADLAEVRRRFGTAVFGEGDDSLELAVARLLKRHGRTVATAESCTGGLLAKRLTDVPGSSAYFLRGHISYSNEAKSDQLNVPPELITRHGAVSEPVAQAMASGCRTASNADFALATTGIAGPGGGTPPDKPVGLVYLGFADPASVEVKRLLLGEHLTRDEIRDRASSAAINLLRLHLLRACGE